LGAFTERDDTDLTEFGIKFGVDIIAVSFTRKRDEIDYVRDLIDRTETLANKDHLQVYAKIENLEGLNNYEEILNVSDGIIISRTDIEQEIPSDKMFLA
jgi:pyruvate kinase